MIRTWVWCTHSVFIAETKTKKANVYIYKTAVQSLNKFELEFPIKENINRKEYL